MSQRFVVLYGGAVGQNGMLNADSSDRCDVAMRVARKQGATIIFGVDEVIPGLRAATLNYLRKHGWPDSRLILNSKAHNSLGEAKAAIEVLRQYGVSQVTVVTSWYHILRVLCQWKLLFRGSVRFTLAKRTLHPGASLLWEIAGFAKLLRILLQRKL